MTDIACCSLTRVGGCVLCVNGALRSLPCLWPARPHTGSRGLGGWGRRRATPVKLSVFGVADRPAEPLDELHRRVIATQVHGMDVLVEQNRRVVTLSAVAREY